MYNLSSEQIKLIKQIEVAFKDDPKREESATTLHQAVAIDDCLLENEQFEARKFDKDNYWQEVPENFIKKIPSPFSFLNIQGKRYYLPAYMRFCVKNKIKYFPISLHAADMLVYCLYQWPDNNGEMLNPPVKEIARSLKLNKNQCRVIFHFLKFSKESAIENPYLITALKEWQELAE